MFLIKSYDLLSVKVEWSYCWIFQMSTSENDTTKNFCQLKLHISTLIRVHPFCWLMCRISLAPMNSRIQSELFSKKEEISNIFNLLPCISSLSARLVSQQLENCIEIESTWGGRGVTEMRTGWEWKFLGKRNNNSKGEENSTNQNC